MAQTNLHSVITFGPPAHDRMASSWIKWNISCIVTLLGTTSIAAKAEITFGEASTHFLP